MNWVKRLIASLSILLLSMQMPRGMHYEHKQLPGPISIHIFTVDPHYATIKAAHAGQEILDLEGEIAQCEFIPIPFNEPENGEAWKEMEYIVGGTPVLISNGEVVTDFSVERTIETFLTKQHPRTALGIKPSGHWVFVVVEGRIPSISLGMTMPELAAFMHSLGCKYALNLDGGGSSALYINDQLRNTPSGEDEDTPDAKIGDERPISDAILIFSNHD